MPGLRTLAIGVGLLAAVTMGSGTAQESPYEHRTRYEICVLDTGVEGEREGLEFAYQGLPPGVEYKVTLSDLIGPCPPPPLPEPIGGTA